MAKTRTVYVKDGQEQLWERAKTLSEKVGISISDLVHDALEEELDRLERESTAREEMEDALQVIELIVDRKDPESGFYNGDTQKIRFTGSLVAQNPRVDVYVTKAGQIVLIENIDIGSNTLVHTVYESFEELEAAEEKNRYEEESHLGDEIMAEIAEALGREWVIEIE